MRPRYGASPHILRTIEPIPTPASLIGSLKCPMKIKLMVYWPRFKKELMLAGTARAKSSLTIDALVLVELNI